MLESTQTQAVLARPALLIDGVRHEMPLGLFRVGRDPQNNLAIEDSNLSRCHFVIDILPGQAQIIDLGSANGTYVNKKRIQSAWLKDKDKIAVGDQIILFQAPGFCINEEMSAIEPTYFKKASTVVQLSWLSVLALLIGSASLLVQLINHDRQLSQDAEMKRIWSKLPSQTVLKVAEPLKPEIKWQKALQDFKSGSEDEACENIKLLLPELSDKDLLKAKAKSFFDRKCVL